MKAVREVRSWLLASAGALCMTTALAQAPKAPASAADISVKQFFAVADYSNMALSPDGTRIAAVAPYKGRGNLVVIDLATKKVTGITASERWDTANPRWIGNKRLLFSVTDGQEPTGKLRLKGAYSVNPDGTGLREVFGYSDTGAPKGLFIQRVIGTEGGDSSVAYVELNQRSRIFGDVYKVDFRTMKAELLSFESPGRTEEWVIDGKRRPRVVTRVEERPAQGQPYRSTMLHRGPDGGAWEKILDQSSLDDGEAMSACGFDSDDRTLFVSARRGRDKAALWAYDTVSKQFKLLVEDARVDVDCGRLLRETGADDDDESGGKVVGFAYFADREKFVAFDEQSRSVQNFRRVMQALGAVPARYSLAKNGTGLVGMQTDVDAGSFYLFDAGKAQLESITPARPWFPKALMAERRFIQYKARDGLMIPAYLTLPRGAKAEKLPLIVNVHGGPMLRAYYDSAWGRWPEAQFFASRGYAVLEPEPRGSKGWGLKHFVSHFKQWGLTMQDDITDGALHLVEQGIVDKGRMCLHGGSYGGYAALQGLVRDPDLFKCGNSFVAVTDLGLLQNLAYSDTAENTFNGGYFANEFTVFVGDSKRDAEQFQKTSPARNADAIKGAVMLTMGSDDVRVPLAHGTAMRDALVKAGKPVDWKVYASEGHGFNKEENVVDFYTRSLEFFDKHIGDKR